MVSSLNQTVSCDARRLLHKRTTYTWLDWLTMVIPAVRWLRTYNIREYLLVRGLSPLRPHAWCMRLAMLQLAVQAHAFPRLGSCCCTAFRPVQASRRGTTSACGPLVCGRYSCIMPRRAHMHVPHTHPVGHRTAYAPALHGVQYTTHRSPGPACQHDASQAATRA